MHSIFAILIAAAAPEVFARNAQAQLDGEALVISFELGARSATALSIRTVDFSLSVQGLPLLSSSAQGFEVPAGGERAILLAGSGERERTLAVLGKLSDVQQFEYRVQGVLHLADGDIPFSVSGTCAIPAEVAVPRRPKQPAHSLLAY